MEDTKPYTSSTDTVALPSFLRPRHVPDVPEDVDFIMEHLNDPNFDLKQLPPAQHPPIPATSDSFELEHKKTDAFVYSHSDIDTESRIESDRYSRSGAASRNSTAIEFDECVHPY